MGEAKAAAHRSPPLMWAGGAILLVAVVLGLVGVHRGVTSPPDTAAFRSDTVTTPVDTTLHLARGGYHLFENTGIDGVRPVTLADGDIALTGAGGEPVGLGRPGDRTTETGEDVYRAVVFFRVPAAGAYHLRVTSSDGGTAQIYVADDGENLLLGRDAYAMWPVLIGAFVAAVGLGVLTAGVSRRSSGPASSEPGWYPDPAAPEGLRWFDGTHWTDYRGAGPPKGSPVRELDP